MSASKKDGGLYFDAGVDLQKLRAEFAKGIKEAQKFTSRVEAEGRKLDQAYSKSSKGIGRFNQGLGKMKNHLGSLVGVAGGVGLTLMLANQLRKITQEAYRFSTGFELALKEVQTISAATQKDFEGTGNALIDMSAKGIDSAEKMTKAYYQIVSAGYDGADGLKLLDVASKAATAGISDTLTSADALTTVMNAWGLSMDKAESVADIMFKTVEKGKTTFPELASNISNVAPVAASLKIPFEEIMGLMATITKQGTPTAMAFTQIRSALAGLAKEYGGTFFEGRTLQESFEAVAKDSNYQLDQILPKVKRIEGANAILAATGQKLAMAKEDVAAMAESTGAMTTAYETMVEAASNKWLNVHNRWNRELKAFGNSLKVSSTALADFLRATMTDPGDVDIFKKLNDGVDGFTERVEILRASGMGLRDSLLGALFNTDQDFKDFNEEENGKRNELISFVEKLNEKTADELEALRLEYESLADKEWDDWMSISDRDGEKAEQAKAITLERYNEIRDYYDAIVEKQRESTVGKGGAEPEDAPMIRSLKQMQTEVEALEERLGTGTAQQHLELTQQIAALNEEIEIYHKNIRQLINDQYGFGEFFDSIHVKTLKPLKPIGSDWDPSKQKFEVEKLAKNEKKLTAEQEEQLRLQLKMNKAEFEQYKLELKRLETGKKLTDTLMGYADVLGALSYALQGVDDQLAETVGRMADMAYNISNAGLALAEGNMLGAVASGIAIMGSLIKLAEGGPKINGMEEFQASLEENNQLLEMQLALLSTISDTDWFALANRSLSTAKEDVEKVMEVLKRMQVEDTTVPQGQWDMVDVSKWTPQDWIDNYLNNDGTYKFYGYYIEDHINSLMEALREYNEVIDQVQIKALGFNTESVADSLLSGVEQGLRLSEGELGEWTNNFGELLKKALSKNILDTLNNKYLEDFMGKFVESMSDNKLTEGERDDLEKLYVESVKQAQNMWNEIAPILNEYNVGVGESALTGAIQGITVEQAGIISGQFTAMREDLKSIDFNMNEVIDIATQQLEVLHDIEENTRHNIRLEKIEQHTGEMALYIKEAI